MKKEKTTTKKNIFTQERKPVSSIPFNEDLFHFITENAEDLIAITDINGKRLYSSASYVRMFGSEAETLVGTDTFKEIHPEDRDRIKQVFQQTIASGVGTRAEYRFLPDDGTVRYIESQGNPIRDSHGNVVAILTVSRDVTERRESESKLRLLAYALSCTKDCFCLTDLDDNILFANSSFYQTYGYKDDELIGKHISLIRSSNNPQEVMEQIVPATLAGGWNGELLNCKKDGTEFPVELWTSLVRNEADVPIGFVGIARDITDRRVAEAALAHESTLWHTLMGNIPDTIYFKDRECRFTRINAAQARVLGVDKVEKAIGKTDFDFFSVDHAQRAYDDEQSVIRTGKPIIGKIEKVTTLDGTIRWFSATKLSIRNSDGTISGIVGSSREITELMLAESQLKESESKYRLLFESNPEAMWVYDLDTLRFLAVNDTAIHRYGWTHQEFLTMTIKDIRPSAEYPKLQEHIKYKLAGTELFMGFRHMKKDGTIIDVEILSHPITFEGSKAHLVIAKDVTERKRAEILQDAVYRIAQAADKSLTIDELFHEVHQIIKTVMPADNFYIALYDEKNDLLSFPYFVDEVDEPFTPGPLGRGLTAYVLRTGKSLLCDQAMDEELQRKGEVELVGASCPIWLGVPLIVENKTIGVMTVQHYSNAKAYSEREQHMLEYVSSQVAKAIERKRAESILQENEQRLRTLVTNAPVVLFAIDREGVFTLSEGKGLAALGLKSGEVVGQSVFELYKNYPNILDAIRRALRGEAFTALIEVDQFKFETHYTPVRDEQGEITGVIGVASDISERRREEQLRAAVYSITQATDLADTLDNLYHRVHEIISSVMPAKNFYIALYDEKEQMVSFPYFVDEVDSDAPPQKIGRGLTGYVLRTGKPLLCDDVRLHELIQQGDAESIGAPSTIWLGVPLIVERKTIGAMVVQHYSDARAYGAREQQVMEFVSSQVAKAIDKKRSEEALQVSEKRFRALIENSSDVIVMVSADATINYASQTVMRVLGYTPEELTGRNGLELVYSDDLEFASKTLVEIVQKPGESKLVILRLRHKDGSVRWIESVVSNLLHEPGVQGIVINFRDITERKQADKALLDSEKKFRTLFEESKDGIFLSTPDGKLLDVNPAGIQLFEYPSKGEILQQDIAKDLYYNPEDRETFKNTLSEQGYVVDLEYQIKTKSGERKIVLESASAVKDDGGNVVAYRGYIRDITERKKLEDQLRQAQKMESIGTLAGGIAHDFNNLLGIILGYASLLEDDKLNRQKTLQSIDTIKKAAERGANLVRQLLTFARKSEAWFESVNANETIKELVKMLNQTFPKTINISVQLDEHLPSIVADAGQLHQALLNLCVNSRDAILDRHKDTTGTGQLVMSTSLLSKPDMLYKFPEATSEEYVMISVHDSGMGMNEETRARIFEPFYTTKELGKGTGLGLSVVYGVINNHRGFINVESEPGQGTAFYLYFPIKKREIAHAQIPSIEEKKISRNNETILVVEDEEMLLDLVKSLLEDRGYNVMTARDGQEGLDKYTTHHKQIACILTDMGLPKLGGWEMFLKMKEVNPDVKAILASGYCDPKIRSEMMNEGAKDFIQKPYVTEIVLNRIREVIDNVPSQ